MICQQLLSLGSFLMVMVARQYSERGRRAVQAHFKGCIATNTKVEGRICQKGPRRLLHWLLRLLNGALLFLKDLGTKLELPEDGFLHLLDTKLFWFVVGQISHFSPCSTTFLS